MMKDKEHGEKKKLLRETIAEHIPYKRFVERSTGKKKETLKKKKIKRQKKATCSRRGQFDRKGRQMPS